MRLRQSIAGHVQSLFIHVHSHIQLLELWKIDQAPDFCALESLTFVDLQVLDDPIFLAMTHAEVAQYTSKLTAVLLTLPRSLRRFNLGIPLFPVDNEGFHEAEATMVRLMLSSRRVCLEGLIIIFATHFTALRDEHVSGLRVCFHAPARSSPMRCTRFLLASVRVVIWNVSI